MGYGTLQFHTLHVIEKPSKHCFLCAFTGVSDEQCDDAYVKTSSAGMTSRICLRNGEWGDIDTFNCKSKQEAIQTVAMEVCMYVYELMHVTSGRCTCCHRLLWCSIHKYILGS